MSVVRRFIPIMLENCAAFMRASCWNTFSEVLANMYAAAATAMLAAMAVTSSTAV